MAIKNSPIVRLSFNCITTTYTRKKKKDNKNEMSSRYRGKSIRRVLDDGGSDPSILIT